MSGNLRKGEEATCLSDSGFDRVFPTASPEFSGILCLCKERLGKKAHSGDCAASEPRVAPANRDLVEIRGSMRLRPPRPPGERANRESQTTEMLCTAEKDSVFGAKDVCSRAARHDPTLPSPGGEGGGECRRMRCSASARYEAYCYFFCLKTVPQAEPTPHHRLRAELPLEGKPKLGSCRAARRANIFCPEYGNFLCCAQYLCGLSLPACPFPGGSRGAEPH